MMPLPNLSSSPIPADNHTLIELLPERWKVVRSDNGNFGRTLFEAQRGGSTVYADEFAQQRGLPLDGLPEDAIRMVVLGWSSKLKAWQLGLYFTEHFARQRQNNRWLELARWHDPVPNGSYSPAELAGNALARVLGVPFRAVIPTVDAPATPAKPLAPLPLAMGDWTLAETDSDHLVFIRQGSWARLRRSRAFWHVFWAVIFAVVSVLSLTVKLGLPTAGTLLPAPHLLPYMGLMVSVILLALAGKNLYQLFTAPDRITIDRATRAVHAYRGERECWHRPEAHLRAVVVSEVAQQRHAQRTLQHLEINLLTVENDYVLVIDSEAEIHLNHVNPLSDEGLHPLDADRAETPSQAAGLYVAQALGGLPCYLDQRHG